MSSLQALREIAMAAAKASETTTTTDDATSTTASAGGASTSADSSLSLPPFSDLLAINQPEIDAAESEIRSFLTAAPSSSSASNTTSSDLTSAWLKLIGIHQHMVTEATKVCVQSGAMTVTVPVTVEKDEKKLKKKASNDDTSAAATTAVNVVTESGPESQEPKAAAPSKQKKKAAKSADGEDDDFDIDGLSTASQYGDDDEDTEDASIKSPTAAEATSADAPFGAEETSAATATTNANRRRITFISQSREAAAADTTANDEERESAATSDAAADDEPSASNEEQNSSAAKKSAKKKSIIAAPLPNVTLPAVPQLLIDAYNSLNLAYERAIRCGGSSSLFTAPAAASSEDGSPPLLRGNNNKTSALLSLMLRKNPSTTSSADNNQANTTTTASSSSSFKLWRMYIASRTQQSLVLRLPLKRVLYPLFERALNNSGNDASTASSSSSGSSSLLGGVALRLWLDYCDLCLLLCDFTKLRIVLGQAFEQLPSTAHHTRFWQLIRHRLFGIGGGNAAAATASSASNNSSSLLSKKTIADSVILSAVAKYNDSLEVTTKFVITKEEGGDDDDLIGGDDAADDENEKKHTAIIKKAIDDNPLKVPLVSYTTIGTATGSTSPSSSSSSSVCSIPQGVLALFWREYVAAFPTQRTKTEYLDFLSRSVYSAVDQYHEQQKKETTKKDQHDDSTAAAASATTTTIAAAVASYMNYLVTNVFSPSTATAQQQPSSGGSASSSSAAPQSTADIAISVTVETWETIAFVLQNLSLIVGSSSSSSSSSTAISQKDVRKWIEVIVSGLERSEFENNKKLNQMISASSASNATAATFVDKKAASAAASATIAAVHIKAKVDIFLSCAVVLSHFGLFDEAFELLWEYVVKAKGAFGRVEVFQKVFQFTCGMLESLAAQCAAIVEREVIIGGNGSGSDVATSSSSSSSSSLLLTAVAEKALQRLESITATYDKLRLDIILRSDPRNVAAWQERITLFRDGFEEGTVTKEAVKRVYMQAIQALSPLAGTTTSSSTGGNAGTTSASSSSAAMDALLNNTTANSGIEQNQQQNNNHHNIAPTAMSQDALTAVVELYEEYANFIYHVEKDYDGLKAFLRRSVLTADFGGDGDAADENGAEDDEDGDDDTANNSTSSSSLRGAKGIQVNVRLLGMLLDMALKHQGAEATRDLLLSWLGDCPLPNNATSYSGGGGGNGNSSSSSASNNYTDNALKKREQSYYRALSQRGNDKLKQRRTEGLFGGGGGGASSNANTAGGAVSGGSGTSASAAAGRIAIKLWLSESTWDVCLHFAALVDRQIESHAQLSQKNVINISAIDPSSAAASNNSNSSNASTTNQTQAKVWSRCVATGMATPWLTMRIATRVLTAAGAQNLPSYVLGKTTSENEAAKNAALFDGIPHSIFGSDWAAVHLLKEKYAAATNSATATAAAAATAGDAFASTSFELFAVDKSLPTAILKKQLTAVRDALAALTAAIGKTTEPIAVAQLSLWRMNLLSEEARLLGRVAEQQNAASAAADSNKNNGKVNATAAVDVSLIREAARATITAAVSAIVLATHNKNATGASSPDAAAAAAAAAAAVPAALSVATAQLLLRYIWFEGQQVPLITPTTTAAAGNNTNGASYLSHCVESFTASGTSLMPALLCPNTLACSLVKRAPTVAAPPTPSSSSASSASLLPPFATLLSDHDRYRVLDIMLKTLVATRGADFTIAVLQKGLSSTSSPLDVSFLSVRLAAVLVMNGDVPTARSVFDKVSPSQVESLYKLIGLHVNNVGGTHVVEGGNNNSNTNAAATTATAHNNSNIVLKPLSATAQLHLKSFWASWLSFELRFGTPVTMSNYQQWQAKVVKILGPVVVPK